MSVDTQTQDSSVDMDVRGEMRPHYAPYELGPEQLFRMLSRRHVISGDTHHLHDAGYRRNVTQGSLADAYDPESTGTMD